MLTQRLAKLTFIAALAAIAALGLIPSSADADVSPNTCPYLDCSGSFTLTGDYCQYYDPATNCTFKCRVGRPAVGFGLCRTDCWER